MYFKAMVRICSITLDDIAYFYKNSITLDDILKLRVVLLIPFFKRKEKPAL